MNYKSVIKNKYIIILLVLICIHFSLAYIKYTMNFIDYSKFVNGELVPPFQYRVLTSWVMGILDIINSYTNFFIKFFKNKYEFEIFIICLLSILVASTATYSTIIKITNCKYSAIIGMITLIYMSYFQYIFNPEANFLLPYDLPSLAFFSVAIYLIETKKTGIYLLIFILATLNRETSVFLILIYILYGIGELKNRYIKTFIICIVQFIIWIAIKYWLYKKYKYLGYGDTDNGIFQITFLNNVKSILNPLHWPVMASNFGFISPIIFINWAKIEFLPLKRLSWVILIWVLSMFLVGVLIEIRIFGELISIMSLYIALIFNKYYGIYANFNKKYTRAF